MTTINLFQHSKDAIPYKAGDVIFKEGDSGDVMYVLVEGEIDIIHHGQVIDQHGAGSLIGEMALLDASPRSATAQAKTNCRVVPITEKRFLFLVQQTPFFALQVMRLMSERLRRKLQ